MAADLIVQIQYVNTDNLTLDPTPLNLNSGVDSERYTGLSESEDLARHWMRQREGMDTAQRISTDYLEHLPPWVGLSLRETRVITEKRCAWNARWRIAYIFHHTNL